MTMIITIDNYSNYSQNCHLGGIAMYSSSSNTPWMFLGNWGLHVPPELPKCSWTLWPWSTWSFPAENLGTASFECSPSLEESRIYHLSSAEMIRNRNWSGDGSSHVCPWGCDGNGVSDVNHCWVGWGIRKPRSTMFNQQSSDVWHSSKNYCNMSFADLHLPTIFPTPFINNLLYCTIIGYNIYTPRQINIHCILST